jgi:glycosyltransferase involved in cell wall biosynthesis
MAISNILYLHETSKIAGAENSLLQLAKNLDIARFKPFFALPEDGPLADALRRCGIDVELVGFPKIRAGSGVIAATTAIRRLIAGKSIALVHSNSIRTNLYGAAAARLSGVPVVWHERNLITTEKLDPDMVLAFLPDAIVCNSRAIARRFEKSGALPAKVQVIYNGVDTKAFNPSVSGKALRDRFGIGADEIVIGIASRFNPDKGHETFLRAAKLIARNQARVRFLIVGGAVFASDAGREKTLRDLALDLGIDDRVVFTGLIQEMAEAYAAMDIVVLASDAEPCGRVIFEAMATGRPMVATDTGGTPEIVVDGETGILVHPRDPAAMASALETLVADRQKRDAMGRLARGRMEALFGIEKNVANTEELYLRLLAKGRSGI